MTILLTGASRGIGFATAQALAAAGHKVLALSRNTDKLAELKASNPERIATLSYDLSQPDPEQLAAWVRAHGQLDAIVNNAGYLVSKPFLALSAADWQRSFEVNFFGPVILIRTLIDLRRSNAPLHIVNVSSMGGFQGSSKFPGLCAYSASKAAVANLTECLAEEWKDENIAVNCLAFGAVQTEMLAEAFPGYQAPMNSEKMAEFFTWFITEGGKFFNGKILPVSVSTP